MEEYVDTNRSQLSARAPSPKADSFFRCQDDCHVVFGCDISLRDEMIVKVSSRFGTAEVCTRLHDRWPWHDHEQYLTMPLGQIRRTIGGRVAH